MSKRPRVNVVYQRKSTINKEIIAIANNPTNTQVQTVLITATFPCTVVGLRWDLTFYGNVTAAENFYWAIINLKEGQTADTISATDGASFYQPEENVIVFGTGRTSDIDAAVGGPNHVHRDGTTKVMRKLQVGDRLAFIGLTAAANGVEVRGLVQFFCKT